MEVYNPPRDRVGNDRSMCRNLPVSRGLDSTCVQIMPEQTSTVSAIDHLENCATDYGFLASTVSNANYRRVWGRDGSITAIAALHTDSSRLVETAKQTLLTLAHHQGPHGEIPSNVDPQARQISYGGTAGRVDSNLWFVIACCQYWKQTGDHEFLSEIMETLERVRFLLACWEFNTRGLLYIPITGDWADEFLQHGYVLYDQLLYLRAQQEMADVHEFLHDSADHQLVDKISRLKHLIRANYWFHNGSDIPEDAYHESLFEKGREAAPRCCGLHWMPFFTPTSYGYRFDAFANVLASIFDVADDSQREAVDEFVVDSVLQHPGNLIPAFHPVITPKDEAWDDLQMTFSYSFKNQPHQYHNGGLWPMVSGFYVIDFAQRGHRERARELQSAILNANRDDTGGEESGFPEFLDGKTLEPGGTRLMAWSAAGEILGQAALDGRAIFVDTLPD